MAAANSSAIDHAVTERLKQGEHPDPLDPAQAKPDPARWTERQRRAYGSRAMHLYQKALLLPGQTDPRRGVLDDLSTYFGLSEDECVRRCVNWEQWSVQEWHAQQRDSAEAIYDFYQKTQSWAFDLLWYSYLQAAEYAYPVSAVIANTLQPPGPGLRHLDFGSGVGVTAQLFSSLGYETTLADISTSLLGFARFRLERRVVRASYIDLNQATLEPGSYDVITAIDTLVHVPDLPATARMLHQALRPNGVLFANFDTRPPTAENAWHLYQDDLPLRWQLQRAGFEPEANLDGYVHRYRRVELAGLPHALRGARDLVLLRSPLRRIYRSLRYKTLPAARASVSRSVEPKS